MKTKQPYLAAKDAPEVDLPVRTGSSTKCTKIFSFV